jgi:hypothetical protein
MVCYKSSEDTPTTLGPGPVEDPVSRTSLWRDPRGPNRPENALIGIMYVGQDLERNYPLAVPADLGRDPLWRHTELADAPAGTTAEIGQELVGWEWDSVVDNGHTPKGLRLLSATPVQGKPLMSATGVESDGPATQHTAAYRADSGALVLAAGSNLFTWGLDKYGYRIYSGGTPQGEPDVRVQQLVTNALAQMGCRPGSPAVDLTT